MSYQLTSLAWNQPALAVVHTILLLSLVLGAVLLFTWVLSVLRSYPSPKGSGHAPPIAPYCIPYLQHLPLFLRDPGTLMKTSKAKYPDSPFTLLMMDTKFHVFDSQSTVHHVFGRSREFAFEPVIASMMENGMNLPEQDRPLFYLSPPGGKATRVSSHSGQFVTGNHNIWLKYLSGKRLEQVMSLYSVNLNKLLAEYKQKWHPDEWFTVDLHEFMRRVIFDVSVVTFFGTRIRKHWPNMWEDWKLFNDATYIGVRSGLVYKLNRRAGKARENMISAFERWIEECDLAEDTTTWPLWSDDWGYLMNREREMLARKFAFSLRGRACLHASFLFVIVTNSAPMATWFAWCASNSSQRLQQYRSEVVKLLQPDADIAQGDYRFDKSALKTNPLVQGLWKEALRLGSASAAARVVMEDSELEGYVVKKGSVILMPVALMHYNEEIFPQPDKVIPERWMLTNKSESGAEEAEEDEANIQRLKRQNLALRSFGGGTGLCSGRFVAEEEVLTLVSTILLMCDVEFGKSWEKYNFDPRSIGIMGPARTPNVRMRLRSKML